MGYADFKQKSPKGAYSAKNYLKSFSELYDRIADQGLLPPQVLDVEQSLLGSCMIDKLATARAIEVLGERGLDSSPFYREAHTWVYQAITTVYATSEPVDILSVTNQLRKSGKLDDVGGPAYLIELTSKIVTTANVESHARLIEEKFLARELIRICEETKLRAFSGEDDTFELLDNAEAGLFGLSETRHNKSFQGMSSLLHESVEFLERIHDRNLSTTGVPSGLNELDEITSGWQKTDLIILAARPSAGKTALSLSIARHAAMNPVKEDRVGVAFFSLEMGATQLTLRMLCSQAGVDMQSARKGKLRAEEWKKIANALGDLNDAKIFIDDTPGITPLELRAKCRRLKTTEDIGLVIVDYLQLMEAGRNMDSREREISMISRSLKKLSKELNIPVIALSQLNRSLESRGDKHKRPMLSDLRESGAIEQDADLVLFIYRPETYSIEQYDDGSYTKGTAEIIVGKQRNGPLGTARVSFRGDVGSFNNLINIPEFEQPSNQQQIGFDGNSESAF